MTEPTAIYVPKQHLMQLFATLAWVTSTADRPDAVERLRPALIELAENARYSLDDVVWRTGAENAYWLQHYSHALDVCGLDECDSASYEHPAVQAELVVMEQLINETPMLWDRLNEQTMFELDAMVATFHDTEGAPA